MLQCSEQQQEGPINLTQPLPASTVDDNAEITGGTNPSDNDKGTSSTLLRIKLVGSVDASSAGRAALRIPPALRSRVSLHNNLPYDRFYDTLYGSYALLPRCVSVRECAGGDLKCNS